MPDVSANGARFHYELDDFTDPWTDAEMIVIQHGFGRSSEFWYQWVPPLAGKYRVIRRDMRGHGQSEDPGENYEWTVDGLIADLKAFLDELGLESVHYVGESVGAMQGVLFASRYPERFKSLTLCSMAMVMRKKDYEEGKLSVPNGVSWSAALDTLGVGGWAESQMIPGIFAGSTGSEERKEWLVSQWSKTPTHVAKRLQAAVMDFDVTPYLGQVHVPTLVIAPTRSALQPLERQVEIYERIPDATIASIDGPGHEVYFDSAPSATAALLKFLQSLHN